MSHAPHGMEPAANPEVDGTDGSWDLTAPLREAIAEGERLIAAAPFIRTEADLLEGYDYLAGRIRMAMQTAFDYDLDRPLLRTWLHANQIELARQRGTRHLGVDQHADSDPSPD